MKKLYLGILCTLFFLHMLLPAGALLAGGFSYEFTLWSDGGVALFLAASSIAAVILSFSKKTAPDSRPAGILAAVLPPLSVLDLLSFILAPTDSDLAVLCLFIGLVCACLLAARRGSPKALKIAGLSVFSLLLIPACLLTFFLTLAWGERSVVSQHPSPDGLYLAEAVVLDQGALGGDTVVYVQDNTAPAINAGLFRITRKPQPVYLGEWYEHEEMEIFWEDEHSLIIQGRKYLIE